MIRLSEIRLPLSALASCPDTHPLDALRTHAAQALAWPKPISPPCGSSSAALMHARPRCWRCTSWTSPWPARPAKLRCWTGTQATPAHPAHARHGLAPQAGRLPTCANARWWWLRPRGIFAALVLAQMGFRPIVLERGKTVRERTKDTWGLWRRRELQAESNVQFGEGGAGTFSDGKLYSQIRTSATWAAR